jgi:hypothetical protein
MSVSTSKPASRSGIHRDRPAGVKTRLDTILALTGPTFRAMRWLPFLVALAAGFVAFEFVRPKYSDADRIVPEVILALRIAMLMIALGVPFVLDDPAEETLASAPTRLWVRRVLRIAFALPILTAAWLLLLRYGRQVLEHTPTGKDGSEAVAAGTSMRLGLPVWGLSREFATYVTTALTLSVLGARLLPERIGSIAAGPALLAIVGGAMLLPRRLTLYAGDPRRWIWADARNRWTIALPIAVGWMLHLCRDPGRRRLRSRISRLKRGRG